MGNDGKEAIASYIGMLGRRGRDRITKFEGVISSVCFDLYGCVQVSLTPPIDKDGKLVDGRFFDVHRVEWDEAGEVVMQPPTFADMPVFAAKPAEHKHGPAEKWERA